MFQLPFEQWDVTFGKSSDGLLPGEKKDVGAHQSESFCNKELLMYSNFGSFKKAIRVVARILGIIENRSFSGGQVEKMSPERLKRAEIFLLSKAQSGIDLAEKQYRSLNPAKNEKGLWVVGASRLARSNPLGIRADLPIFVPKGHPVAELAMRDAHCRGHRGRDATLSTFRGNFWTPSGPSLAKAVLKNCQMCKLRDGKLMSQAMGALPVERTTPSPPFNLNSPLPHCTHNFFPPTQPFRNSQNFSHTHKSLKIILHTQKPKYRKTNCDSWPWEFSKV